LSRLFYIATARAAVPQARDRRMAI
jgi:hypothetical protein